MKKKILAFLLFLGCWSCGDDAPRFTVPYAPVYFKVDVDGVDYALKGALGFKTFTTEDSRTPLDRLGYSGLLVVRSHDASALYAYDLCCPHECEKQTVVVPSSEGKATCKTCGTVYVTMFGTGHVESGPGKKPLQRYAVSPQSNGVFIITNQ